MQVDIILGNSDLSTDGVEELNGLDRSYTPPLGSPRDAVQVASQQWIARCGLDRS